jgi:hypothetical protein
VPGGEPSRVGTTPAPGGLQEPAGEHASAAEAVRREVGTAGATFRAAEVANATSPVTELRMIDRTGHCCHLGWRAGQSGAWVELRGGLSGPRPTPRFLKIYYSNTVTLLCGTIVAYLEFFSSFAAHHDLTL